MPKAAAGFYAVRRGRRVGIWTTWSEAEESVRGFPGARHKKFPSRQAAQQWLDGDDSVSLAPAPAPAPAAATPHATASTSQATTSATASPSASTWRRVWTDGASAGNGQAGARAGIGVHWGMPSISDLSERLPGPRQTSSRAELYAVLRALQTDPQPELPLLIVTDSTYAISGLTEWLPKWQANGFKTATGQIVANQDLILAIAALLAERPTRPRFQHVRAHQTNGDPGNAQADALAVAGARLPAVPEMQLPMLGFDDANITQDALLDVGDIDETMLLDPGDELSD